VPPVEPVRVALGPSGALLRSARESKSLSIAQVSEATHISARYLEALEAEDFTVLPSATAFVKGYVREVARLLDLDEDRVVAGYMRRFSGDA
jgi:cytoskeletal protein RodZ